ncbi:MAG: 50S ribosomal protein L21 [Thaumarchaeota archaeon]|jgi:large subunit ribosomal protein L21e|nr:50S ribosomal protein L21 [Nitrososphaerota archaeon]
MPHYKGYRRKTRKLLTIESKRGLSYLLNEFKNGDKVVIKIDPSQPKGMPHRRFQGRVGKIIEVRKRSLVVEVQVGNKKKILYTRLEHVVPFKGESLNENNKEQKNNHT